MNVVILGISGRAGSRLGHELLQRGHQVTGIARDVSNVPAQSGLTLASADVADVERLVPLLKGHDAVISTTRFVGSDAVSLIGAVKAAGVPRLLVVGGAGSLEMAPGVALIDTPEFPAAYKDEASAGRDFLNVLRGETALDWTFLSPSALFEPGQRTGRFRIGTDSLLVDADGNSAISMEDYAIALVDELEKPQHSRQRFTVGY
ncbi:NAD(P)-dependent oxidoreductase [Pseudomonas fulva]|uniref:Conserved hypothethical protein, NAD(P)-binding protein n=1 Tax=Pseudomonas fulva (strain 12-X) TaxID=743720 RepID=F6ADI6_PSEF1|nr:NAD(P)-dependent oxidoreductase [Pseudomonas fulva]AEF20127.1 conserved hypothethical protein, NAD(P)-binding protein [Pseudomonas fulva 12-X]